MGQEAGESVKQLNYNLDWIEDSLRVEDESKLFYDDAPEEDLESFDGVSRVEELENILGEIIDLWDEHVLVSDWKDVEELFDRAGAILNKEDYE